MPVGILRILCQEYRRSDWQSTLSAVPPVAGGGEDGVGGEGEEEGEEEDDEDEEDDEGEDFDLAFAQSRPLFRVDLARFIEDAVRQAVRRGDGEYLTGMYWALAPAERRAFRTLWSRATAPPQTPA